jgi:alcohol dehydrogenase
MPVAETFEFFNPLKILSGQRALENLPIELQWLGASRPYCLWAGDVRKKDLGLVIRAFKGSAMALTVFEKMATDPDSSRLEQMAADFSMAACDAILVIGDHPQLQTARQLSLLLSHQPQTPALPRATDRPMTFPLPLIQIFSGPREPKASAQPADTAASRSEAPSDLLPALVVIDPRLLPRSRWLSAVSAALSVLAHCSESVNGPFGNPVADGYAQAAIRAVMHHLTGFTGKDNLPAAKLALANAMVLCQCVRANSSTGLSHLLGQELARVSRVPSGILTGMILPYALEVAARSNPDAVAELLLPLGGAELYGITTDCLRARKAVNLIHELLHTLNQRSGGLIPATLQQADVTEETLVQVARAASHRDLAGDQESLCLEILKHAWLGRPLSFAGCQADGRVMDA